MIDGNELWLAKPMVAAFFICIAISGLWLALRTAAEDDGDPYKVIIGMAGFVVGIIGLISSVALL